MQSRWSFLRSWEGLLLILLIVIVIYNALNTPGYLTVNNWVNLFQLSIEKIIVALIMTFIIINAEIDLSVASVMGLSACLVGFLYAGGMPMEGALAARVVGGRGRGAVQQLLDRHRRAAVAGGDALRR
jgi:rhamnose transport system permease protein